MDLSQVRIVLGMTAVAVGTAWGTGGVDAVRVGASLILGAVPALAVLAGILFVLRIVAPRGALAGPLVLILAGSVALAVQFGTVTDTVIRRIPPLLLIVGGAVIAMSRRADEPALPNIVARYSSVFIPAAPSVRDPAPRKLIVRCVLGHITLDLTKIEYPAEAYQMPVDVTMLWGRVELSFPSDWEVRAGRLELARGTRFEGQLSSRSDLNDKEVGNLVVLNVQGMFGTVVVSSRSAQPPLDVGDGSD